MASSENTVVHPIRTFLLSLLVFLLLDAAIFRSGLYNHVLSPQSVQGKFYWSIRYEQQRQADPARDVLVLGNSKIEWGLSVRQIEQQHLADNYHFISGAAPATQMEWWYYQLSEVDPHHDRYRAVVIPVNGYLIRPEAEVLKLYADYSLVLAIAPFLSAVNWKEFDTSITDRETRAKLHSLQWFAARKYSADVADLVVRPVTRVKGLIEREKIGTRWLYYSDGIGTDTIDLLRFDYGTGVVLRWPEHFEPARKTESMMYIMPAVHPKAETEATLRYNADWLNRIIALYRGSRTRLVLSPLPAYGVAMAGIDPIPGGPDIRSVLDTSDAQVIALEEAAFKALQKPELFYDTLHLNNEGRVQFTRMFAEEVSRAIK